MKKMILSILLATMCSAASCNTNNPPTPDPVPTVPPAPPGPPVVNGYTPVCQHLADIGCSAGSDPGCAATMQHTDDTHLTTIPTSCLMDAQNPDQARACGFVRCQ